MQRARDITETDQFLYIVYYNILTVNFVFFFFDLYNAYVYIVSDTILLQSTALHGLSESIYTQLPGYIIMYFLFTCTCTNDT